MNSRWVLLAFVAGVGVGVAATRIALDRPRNPTANAVEISEPRVAGRATPAVATAADRIPTPVSTPKQGEAKPLASISVPMTASTDPIPTSADDAFVQRIDVGPVFAESIARPSQPGFENQMGDAHRALERETRNEGWAYTMEGEIQNSMVNEVSTGEFRAEHVECRATMCEVRLSGTARQAEAVKAWRESIGQHTFSQPLSMNYSSTTANDERIDVLLIFRKPPIAPPRPH